MIKMSILPKLIYRFNAIPTKIPAKLFVDIDKFILKFIGKDTDSRSAETILAKNKWEELFYPKLKIIT